MNEIKALTEFDWIMVVLGLVAIMVATKYIIELVGYFKKKFRITTGIESDKESIEYRITKLEESDKSQITKIDEISNNINKLTDMFVDKELNDMRWEIINLADKLSNGKTVGKEAYKHALKTYDEYENLICKLGKSNGETEISIGIIKEEYTKMLKREKVESDE